MIISGTVPAESIMVSQDFECKALLLEWKRLDLSVNEITIFNQHLLLQINEQQIKKILIDFSTSGGQFTNDVLLLINQKIFPSILNAGIVHIAVIVPVCYSTQRELEKLNRFDASMCNLKNFFIFSTARHWLNNIHKY
ncbi:hypothetical protein KAR48_03815 [bacterium]|nr:hypothetical protein [bacterium]